MHLHILQHESFESPAAILDWASSRRHQVSFTKFYQNEVLPKNLDGIDFLVIMGGPQSPATTKSECSYFDAKKEIEFIKSAIEKDTLVLGVCLGAQLIGVALGATFDHSPNKEIGVFDITLTNDAKNDPLFFDFPNTFKVGHWHADMPGLTKESKVLAISEGCPRQVIMYRTKVYGFQCHFEFTPSAIGGMIQNNKKELEDNKGKKFIQSESELRKNNYKEINEYLFKVLDRFVKS